MYNLLLERILYIFNYENIHDLVKNFNCNKNNGFLKYFNILLINLL